MKNEKHLVKEIEKAVDRRIKRNRKALTRYPVFFGMLGTIGVVASVLGLEGIINELTYLNENSFALFFIGITILIATGAIHRLLNN